MGLLMLIAFLRGDIQPYKRFSRTRNTCHKDDMFFTDAGRLIDYLFDSLRSDCEISSARIMTRNRLHRML